MNNEEEHRRLHYQSLSNQEQLLENQRILYRNDKIIFVCLVVNLLCWLALSVLSGVFLFS